MPCFNRLLCLLSEESPSSAALEQAVHLSSRLRASLHLGHTDDVPPDAVASARQAAEMLGNETARPPNWAVQDTLVESISALEAHVHAHDVDLIVTDTPPDQGPTPLLAAPSLRALVHRLDCSLLVVEQQTPFPSPRRLLVPTDLSPPSHTALEYATALAAPSHTAIDLLHVLETVPYVALTRTDRLSLSRTSFPERRARRQMEALLDDDAPHPVNTHVEYGDPADQIGHFLHRRPPDLMVLTPHGTHAPADVPLGPVASRVLRRVACPVLLLRSLSPNVATTCSADSSS
jgi:nucleotide-binding universal stress UspA family protein